jgi:FixJ family two-component response regulator
LPSIPPFIYIVDDDPAVVKAMKRLLHSWGMHVRTFGSGREFLAALRRSCDGDCSVIDVQMPGMTGLEVQEALNRAGIDVPVIFITAHNEEGVEERAMRAGAVGLLRKPFMDETLVGLIHTALQRPRKGAAHEGRQRQGSERREESFNGTE